MTQLGRIDELHAGYRGLRMTADEFLALPEDDARYELVDGGVLRQADSSGDRYASTVLPGFELDLDRVQRLF